MKRNTPPPNRPVPHLPHPTPGQVGHRDEWRISAILIGTRGGTAPIASYRVGTHTHDDPVPSSEEPSGWPYPSGDDDPGSEHEKSSGCASSRTKPTKSVRDDVSDHSQLPQEKRDTPTPILNFDHSGVVGYFHFVTFMRWPDPSERVLRLATYGASLLDQQLSERFFEGLIALSDDPAAQEGRQYGLSSLARLLKEFSLFSKFHVDFMNMIESRFPPVTISGHNISSFERFLDALRHPEVRESLRAGIWEWRLEAVLGLVVPSGGFDAVANGPAYDEINREIGEAWTGHPYYAGLALSLIARAEEAHRSDFAASFNRICFLMDNQKKYKVSTRTIKEAWSKWKALSPLWAGAIAELDHKRPSNHELNTFLADENRRARAIAYAQWFARFATGRRADATLPPLIDEREVMRFETLVAEAKPPLPAMDSEDVDLERFEAGWNRDGGFRRGREV
jgi:hypothetical protein